MRRLAAIVPSLTVSLLAVMCTSTPVPIPPSMDPGLVTMEMIEPTPECMEGCILIQGRPGATDPFVHVSVSRVHAMPVDFPLYDTVVAGSSGEFDVILGGAPEGVFRFFLHNDSATVAFEFTPVTVDPPPWPMEEAPVELDGLCMGMDLESVDFGTISVGETVTEVVNVRNNCDVPMEIQEVLVTYEPGEHVDPEPAIWGLGRRPNMLEPGASTGIVVGFWPIDADVYSGALVIEVLDTFSAEFTVLSLPVRGEAVF